MSNPFFLTWHTQGLISPAAGHVCWGPFCCPCVMCTINSKTVIAMRSALDLKRASAIPVDALFDCVDDSRLLADGIMLNSRWYTQLSGIASRWLSNCAKCRYLNGKNVKNMNYFSDLLWISHSREKWNFRKMMSFSVTCTHVNLLPEAANQRHDILFLIISIDNIVLRCRHVLFTSFPLLNLTKAIKEGGGAVSPYLFFKAWIVS